MGGHLIKDETVFVLEARFKESMFPWERQHEEYENEYTLPQFVDLCKQCFMSDKDKEFRIFKEYRKVEISNVLYL